jgi:enamine deaminase RidA (YjgF/YER057c/UK114 family)
LEAAVAGLKRIRLEDESSPAPADVIVTDHYAFATGSALDTGKDSQAVLAGSIVDEIRVCVESLERKLSTGGSSLADVVTARFFLADAGYEPSLAPVLATYWNVAEAPLLPVVIAGLPSGCRVRVDAIAVTTASRN